MSPITWVVVGFVTLLSVLAVVATLSLVVRHTARLLTTLRQLRDDITPQLTHLRMTADVAQREWQQIQDERDQPSKRRGR